MIKDPENSSVINSKVRASNEDCSSIKPYHNLESTLSRNSNQTYEPNSQFFEPEVQNIELDFQNEENITPNHVIYLFNVINELQTRDQQFKPSILERIQELEILWNRDFEENNYRYSETLKNFEEINHRIQTLEETLKSPHETPSKAVLSKLEELTISCQSHQKLLTELQHNDERNKSRIDILNETMKKKSQLLELTNLQNDQEGKKHLILREDEAESLKAHLKNLEQRINFIESDLNESFDTPEEQNFKNSQIESGKKIKVSKYKNNFNNLKSQIDQNKNAIVELQEEQVSLKTNTARIQILELKANKFQETADELLESNEYLRHTFNTQVDKTDSAQEGINFMQTTIQEIMEEVKIHEKQIHSHQISIDQIIAQTEDGILKNEEKQPKSLANSNAMIIEEIVTSKIPEQETSRIQEEQNFDDKIKISKPPKKKYFKLLENQKYRIQKLKNLQKIQAPKAKL